MPHRRLGIGQRRDEPFDGAALANLRQRAASCLPDIVVGILQNGGQRLDRLGIFNTRQSFNGCFADIPMAIGEGLDQNRKTTPIADDPKGCRGRSPNGWLRIAQTEAQRLDGPSISSAAERFYRGHADACIRILQCTHERFDGSLFA